MKNIFTTSGKKGDVIDWLWWKHMDVNSFYLKDELLREVAILKQTYDKNLMDRLVQNDGKKVLQLLPYHLELNPIELICSKMKSKFAKYNR